MTFDLDAARALHDRDPEAPHACATCRDRTGLGMDWPCPTATALGATGRSEWAHPTYTVTIEPSRFDTDMAHITARIHGAFGDTTDQPPGSQRCPELGCVLPVAHQSAHLHPDGDRSPLDPCGAPWNPHSSHECTLHPNHSGPHREDTYTWAAEPCTTPGLTFGCIFTDGHLGACKARPSLRLTPACHAPQAPSADTCILGADHAGRHATHMGFWWPAPGGCTSTSPSGRPCEDHAGHHGLHHHGDLYRWHPDPCVQATNLGKGWTGCVLANGHTGIHYFESDPHDTARCTTDDTPEPCALHIGHRGPHISYGGYEMKDTHDDA